MKYRKPEIVDLGAGMKWADGQNTPNSCVEGSAATGIWQTCANGIGAGNACNLGGDVIYGGTSCVPGNSTTTGDCLSGSSVPSSYFCEAGSGGRNDYYGCTTGPSYSV